MNAIERARGVTLIEVLISVLVLSIGLLGLAALQGFSLQAGQGAYHRTQATNLAYEITDFTRLNRSTAMNTCDIPVLDAWKKFAASQLPGGKVGVEFIDCGLGEIQVSITWSEERIDDAVEGGESLVVTTRI